LYFEVAGENTSGDTVWWFASQGKLFASVAVMQAVERGLITLDDDISPIFPEIANLEVVSGQYSDGKIETKKRTNKITLR
jgi:methyl acetate hydrolase